MQFYPILEYYLLHIGVLFLCHSISRVLSGEENVFRAIPTPNGDTSDYLYIQNSDGTQSDFLRQAKENLENFYCQSENCLNDNNVIQTCHILSPENFNMDSPSIMFGEPKGRFGNQLLGYAVLHQLQVQLGVKSYITKETKDFLLEFFTPESVTLPVFNETFCNWRNIQKKPFTGSFQDLLTQPGFRKGFVIDFYPGTVTKDGKIVGGYRPEEHLCKEQEQFQRDYVKHVRKNMKFRYGSDEKAQRRLLGMARKRKINPKKVNFIGVHVRKTDHADFMMKQHDMEPIEDDYYDDAIEYMRENYDNCIFVVASDDIEWCKKHIDATQGDVFFSDSNPTFKKDEHGNLFDADYSKAAYDLALLSNCNHTIVSRGTYSLWVAMLAGGEYYTEYGAIVPPHLQG